MKNDNVIWVDENDKELGIVSREEAHQKGLIHRIAVVYLVKDNQILVQERASGRLDHSAAGHLDPGESYLQAAKRELKEELGIECSLILIGKTISDETDSKNNKHVRHIFEVYEGNSEPGKLQKEEVRKVYWDNPQNVFEEMKNDIKDLKFCGGFKASLQFYLEHK